MVKQSYYYDILNLKPNCTTQEIRQAFRKLALRFHPDKCNSCDDKFNLISIAYNILSDPESRKIYDSKGLSAFNQQSTTNNDNNHENSEEFVHPENIFEMFFSHSYSHSQKYEKYEKDIVIWLDVSLQDLYQGALKTININKIIICDFCKNDLCTKCSGEGTLKIAKKINLNMVEYIFYTCDLCKGTGKSLLQCQQCQNKKKFEKTKLFTVNISKGMFHKQKIIFKNEGNEFLSGARKKTGDLIVILKQKPHDIFTRHNDDLLMTVFLDIRDVLCGFEKTIKTLDNRILLISNTYGIVTKHDSLKFITGLGMPLFSQLNQYGNLIIKFSYNFPESLNEPLISQLKLILPKSSEDIISDDAEIQILHDLDAKMYFETYDNNNDNINENSFFKEAQCTTH